MEEQARIMCINVEDAGLHYEGIDGSVKGRCATCKQQVWISPSGVKIIADKGAEVICSRCFVPYAEKASKDEPLEIAINPSQLRELFEQIRIDAERGGQMIPDNDEAFRSFSEYILTKSKLKLSAE